MDTVKKREIKIDIWSIVKVVGLLYFILILVGILTYTLPSGRYQLDESGHAVAGTFEFVESSTRIPWYRWLTSPVETLLFDSAKMTLYQIIALILILGGCFKVLEDCGSMQALIKMIIIKFKNKRFLAIWIITFLMMLLASFFGIQDELLILFPIFLSFAEAMKWSKTTALSLVLITTSSGFTCALLNPLTIGICSHLAEISPLSAIWYRAIMFSILFVITSIFVIRLAKKDEKQLVVDENLSQEKKEEIDNLSLTKEEKRNAMLMIYLFMFVLLIVVVCSAIPSIQKLGIGLIAMGGAFVIGTVVIGRVLIGSWKKWFKSFYNGLKSLAPSIFVIVTAFAIKYIAEKGDIIHTIFYYMYDLFTSTSPYLGVIIMLFLILVLEFFIPSASAKAGLIIPLLTLAPIPGISTNVIILCYILGDGYTNVIFPTCGTLMIGLGVANVSYIDWMKRTGLFQLLLLGTSIIFLVVAVAIGL